MDERFGKNEKLKQRKHIQALFSEGKSMKEFPIKLIYAPNPNLKEKNHKIGVSVPKRNFKKAVDRNYLKRLMREGYRKNKYLVKNLEPSFYMMFVFLGKKESSPETIFNSMEILLKKISKKEGSSLEQL